MTIDIKLIFFSEVAVEVCLKTSGRPRRKNVDDN